MIQRSVEILLNQRYLTTARELEDEEKRFRRKTINLIENHLKKYVEEQNRSEKIKLIKVKEVLNNLN